MGIASNNRYQLVRGLRRSLRMTPPFTGRRVRDSEISTAAEPREEQDRPAPRATIKTATGLPVAPKPVEAAANSPAAGVETAQPMVIAAAETATLSSTAPTKAPEAATSTLTASPPALPVQRRGSALSFAAGLLLGVAASSAGWTWMHVEAAEVTAAPSAGEAKPKSSAPAPARAPLTVLSPKPSEPTAKSAVGPAKADPKPVPPTSPAVTESPPPPRAIPASEFDKWKVGQVAAIEAEFPELHAWFNTVTESTWRTASYIISGSHPSVKSRTPAQLALLKWLILHPPADPDTRRAVHNLYVRMAPVSQCLDLWEPLVGNGATNTKDIQAAADALRIMREDSMNPDQKRRLQAIIDHPAAKAES